MSVPNSRRGESPAQFIDCARNIMQFTYNRVRMLPKSYTFYFSIPLYNEALAANHAVRAANDIYIHHDEDVDRRRVLFEEAMSHYNSMLDILDLAYNNIAQDKLPPKVLETWVGLIKDEITQISKIKKSDRDREIPAKKSVSE